MLDPAANTTDVYAFVDQDGDGPKSLVVALGVFPFEEPGIGPNKFNFDDNVLYEIHVALGGDRTAGRATLSYQFEFKSRTRNPDTILDNFTGVIEHVGDKNQNFIQTYTVTKVDHRTNERTVLGCGIVPPNNQGNLTPYYNQGDPPNGENPARPGVSKEADLDRYNSNHDRDPEKTVILARQALAARPNVYCEDVLAWALLKMGDAEEAWRHMQQALRLGTPEPRFFFHAGMINCKLGRTNEALSYLKKALDLNPHFSVLEADKARQMLMQLQTKVESN